MTTRRIIMKKRIIKKKVDQTCSVVITMAWMENPKPDFTPLTKNNSGFKYAFKASKKRNLITNLEKWLNRNHINILKKVCF